MYSFASYQDCVDPGLEILLRLIKLKKNNTIEIITELIKSHIFFEATRKILNIHDCNLKIMTKILSTIFYLKSEKFYTLLSISKLKNLFMLFKNNGFDLIHEVIIFLFKSIIANRINSYHKLNPINNYMRNHSMTLRSEIRRSKEKSSSASPNFNKSKSLKSNQNKKNKKFSLGSSNKIIKNKTNPNFKSNCKNQNVNSNYIRVSNFEIKTKINHEESNLNNDTHKISCHNKIKKNDKFKDETEKSFDYGNQYPTDKSIAYINGELFDLEEFIDILSIFNQALNMIKFKIYQMETQKNNLIFYKFINCVEIMSFLILTIISCKENTEKLRYLLYYKMVENLIAFISINMSRGIYQEINQNFYNKQYLMINYKISIVKKFYYIFKIIDIIKNRVSNFKVMNFYF